MSSQVKIQEKKRGRRSWPVMGFLLIVAFTVIAYLIAPGVIDWLRDNLRGFRTTGMNQTTLRWVFTAIIALILSLFAGMIIAVAAPKKPINVKMSDLAKERDQLVDAKAKRKKQQRRINREYREHVEGKNK